MRFWAIYDQEKKLRGDHLAPGGILPHLTLNVDVLNLEQREHLYPFTLLVKSLIS